MFLWQSPNDHDKRYRDTEQNGTAISGCKRNTFHLAHIHSYEHADADAHTNAYSDTELNTDTAALPNANADENAAASS